MKHKVSELEGNALDYAVCLAEGMRLSGPSGAPPTLLDWHAVAAEGQRWFPAPSTSWSQAGPIIEREGIYLWRAGVERDTLWAAGYSLERWKVEAGVGSFGPTPLIAAMRARVASKFGAEVELP